MLAFQIATIGYVKMGIEGPQVLFGTPYVVGWGLLAGWLGDSPRGVVAVTLGIAWFFGGMFGLGAVVGLAVFLTKRLAPATSLPENLGRVRDLTATISPEKRRQLESPLQETRSAAVWPTVRQIVAEELDVSLESVERRTGIRGR